MKCSQCSQCWSTALGEILDGQQLSVDGMAMSSMGDPSPAYHNTTGTSGSATNDWKCAANGEASPGRRKFANDDSSPGSKRARHGNPLTTQHGGANRVVSSAVMFHGNVQALTIAVFCRL